jgi:phosphate transport system permease protein
MTAYIAGAGSGDLPVDSFDYRTIFAVGAVLFLFTFLLNALSVRMVRRFREVYE